MTKGKTCRERLRDNSFLILTSLGIGLGFLLGLSIQSVRPNSDTLMWIGLIGELYMRALKVIILPLIVCTIITGTSSTDAKSSGKIGFLAITYIVLTNALGGIVGIILCLLVEPGSISGNIDKTTQLDARNLQTVDILADFIRNIFPDNVIGAALQVSQTKYTELPVTRLVKLNSSHTWGNGSDAMVNVTVKQLTRSLGSASGTNVLGLIVVSAAFGIAASKVKDRATNFINFFKAGADITFTIFDWLKWQVTNVMLTSTPVGVASLIARAIAGMEDVTTSFSSMGMYVVVVAGGNIAFQILVLGAIYAIFTRRNPVRFFMNVANPWLMAVGPPSSALPLPVLHKISTDIYKVDPRVAGFVLPFSVTLNRNGSCLFVSASCLFIAQYSGLALSTGAIVTIGLLSIMSSLAIPNVPSASVVTILIILSTVGIPATNVGIVMALEWINDRARSTTNLVSHQLAVLIAWKFCKRGLRLQSATRRELNVLV
ncbi:excitatory amino acid transporter-like isoform X1 [Biomphalaria pfeifferi]|uniref:Amino acid transporter n=1 Tax=Biomphalaria pfeifferi TaxID=112525 RepID=A0AAD8AR52_BIOPF|nr:excitatory amino acid transporter-like isoform X1 [Biomphalaria pfeifferi]